MKMIPRGVMILENGKFWKDGKEVLPRIGDAEQIELLKQAERHFDEKERLRTEGIRCQAYYEAEISFECLCGADIYHSRSFSAWHSNDIDPENDFDGCVVSCCKCGSVYKIYGDVALIVE